MMLLFLVVMLVLIVMMLLFLVVMLVLIVMMFLFIIMVVFIIMKIHVIHTVKMSVLITMVVMSLYAIVVFIPADGKPDKSAPPDPGQASRYILRIDTAVLQDAAPGLARLQFAKSRDIVIVGIARHSVYVEGKLTCAEVHAAGAGHTVRDRFILQGHLGFHIVRHVIQYAAVHIIDNAAACAAAEQQRCGTAKNLNLLAKHRFQRHPMISAESSCVHGAEPIFQHLHAAAAQPPDNRTAHSRAEITGRDTQFIGNRFTNVADAAGFQFFFRQDLYRSDYMSIDLG